MAHPGHAHHEPAREWFHSCGPDQVWFCRFTQMGMLRLLTNPSVMKNSVLTSAQAWDVFDAFMNNARVRYMEEPMGVETHFRRMTRNVSRHNWSDAYIAAIAARSNRSVVTFDAGFASYDVPALILDAKTMVRNAG